MSVATRRAAHDVSGRSALSLEWHREAGSSPVQDRTLTPSPCVLLLASPSGYDTGNIRCVVCIPLARAGFSILVLCQAADLCYLTLPPHLWLAAESRVRRDPRLVQLPRS